MFSNSLALRWFVQLTSIMSFLNWTYQNRSRKIVSMSFFFFFSICCSCCCYCYYGMATYVNVFLCVWCVCVCELFFCEFMLNFTTWFEMRITFLCETKKIYVFVNSIYACTFDLNWTKLSHCFYFAANILGYFSRYFHLFVVHFYFPEYFYMYMAVVFHVGRFSIYSVAIVKFK